MHYPIPPHQQPQDPLFQQHSPSNTPPYQNPSFQQQAHCQSHTSAIHPQYLQWQFQKRRIRQMGSAFFLVTIFHSVAMFLLGVFYSAVEGLFLLLPDNVVLLNILDEAFPVLFYLAAILFPFSFYRKLCGNPPIPNLEEKVDLPVLLSATGISLGISLLGSLASTFLLEAFQSVGLGPPDLSLPVSYDWFTVTMSFISVVLLPSVIEELIFRQALLGSLQPYGNWFAIFTSAFLFGIYHANMAQLPYCFVLGVCLAYFVLKTRSIYTGMFIHFVNNLLAWGLDQLSCTMSDEAFTLLYLGEWGMRIFFALAGLLFLGAIRRVQWSMPKGQSLLSGGDTFKAYFLSPGIIALLIIYAIQIFFSFS